MSNSFIVFCGQRKRINDWVLFGAIFFVLEAIALRREKEKSTTQLLTALDKAWCRKITDSPPGLMDLELDILLAEQQHLDELQKTFKTAKDIVNSFGEKIPREYINAKINNPGIMFADYPTKNALEDLNELETFINKAWSSRRGGPSAP
jgi:hypothetical protein